MAQSNKLYLGTQYASQDVVLYPGSRNILTIRGDDYAAVLQDSDIKLFQNEASAAGQEITFYKSRNTTDESAATIVADGDVLGSLKFKGANGAGADVANFSEGARIEAAISGTPGDDDLPTSLTFYTTPDGSETPAVNARIEPNGDFGVRKIKGITGVASDLHISGAGASGDVKINNGDGRDVFVYNAGSTMFVRHDASELATTFGSSTVPQHSVHVQDGDIGIVTNQASADAKRLIFSKSRDTADGGHSSGAQADDDAHGEILWRASDGDQYINTGSIMVRSYGASSNNSVPSEMIFRVNQQAADLPALTAAHAYFRTNGNTGFGDSHPNYHFVVGGGKSSPIQYTFNTNTSTIGTAYTSAPSGAAGMIIDHRHEGEALYLMNSTATNTADQSKTGIGFFRRVDLGTDEYHYMGAIRMQHEGSAADQKGYMTFFTNSGADNRNVLERMRIDSAGSIGIGNNAPGAHVDIKGLSTLNLSDSTSVVSDGATGTNRYVASTDHDLLVGQAVTIGGSTYSVATVTDADNFILDSDHGSTGDQGQATTDGVLLKVQSSDGSTIFAVNGNGAIEAGFAASNNRIVAIGDSGALANATTAKESVFIGHDTGDKVTSGNNNTCVGFKAGEEIAAANDNTYIGRECGNGVTGSSNTAIGANCLSQTGSANNNVGIGANCMDAFTGADSVAIGKEALDASSSVYSTAVGYQSLTGLTGGSLESNSAFGYRSGMGLDTGQQCLFLGSEADTTDVDGNNQIAIGHGAVVDAPNTMVLGNASLVLIRPNSDGNVELGNASKQFDDVFTETLTESSDARVKENIEDTSLGLNFINRLRPVSYKLKDTPREVQTVVHTDQDTYVNDEGEEVTETRTRESEVVIHPGSAHIRRHEGLIAQEVKTVLDEIGIDPVNFAGYVDANISGGADKLALRYREFIGPLIKSVQELSSRLEALENAQGD